MFNISHFFKIEQQKQQQQEKYYSLTNLNY